MKSDTKHLVMRNEGYFCSHCGGQKILVMPMPITQMTVELGHFQKIHKDCKPRWQQPMPDPKLSYQERLYFWIIYGEHGKSSMLLFNVLSKQTIFPVSGRPFPLDPSDFNRCSMLLKMVPELKRELVRHKHLSPQWASLIEHWEELEAMLEENKANTENNMYDFIKRITTIEEPYKEEKDDER